MKSLLSARKCFQSILVLRSRPFDIDNCFYRRLMTSIHAAKMSKCDSTSSDSIVSNNKSADEAQIVNPCSKTVATDAKTKAKTRLQRKKSDRKKSLKRL